jgi:hypothetical protein
VTAVRRDGEKLQLNEEAALMFHPGYPSLKELKEGVAGFLDIVKVKSNETPSLALGYIYPAVDSFSFFSVGHTHQIDVSITGDSMRTRKCTFVFDWTGDQRTAEFNLLEHAALSKISQHLDEEIEKGRTRLTHLAASTSPIAKVVEDTVQLIREGNVSFTLYALQKAGVGTLDTEVEFQAAREAIIQRNLPDPIKDLSITEYDVTWLALIQYANRKETALYNPVAVYDCLQRMLRENQQTLPKKPIHIAVDRLRALQTYGKKMRQRLCNDEPPIPTNREIEEWTKEIVDVAASCATLVERDNLRVHYKYLGLHTFVLKTNKGRKEYEERIGTVSAKLHIIGKIIARLLNEDMLAHL